ncbi:hypothetical protein OIU83_00455 [Flavobacterium sp. LS1R49]|uniref:DUF1579 domain-containing protein n=1 Tax=Flavobacterium shii TaxID=2987687 RepID=A0A9X2Z8X6_9FLAO|nr:hypothetical protein [Flavobacterium shii]MCV9926109.1 hypothetical protein [Flavobacterium shii]
MTVDNLNLEIPKLIFNASGELIILPSLTSSKDDFDFFQGKSNIINKKLKYRFSDCTEWIEFPSTQEMHKVLNGIGNIDNFLAEFDGVPFEGMTVRLFNPETKLWSIYWSDSNTGVLDKPVIGSFEKKVGHFFSRDIYEGKKVIQLFRWDARDKNNPIWSQAMSVDNGETWEWNWYMYMTKVK